MSFDATVETGSAEAASATPSVDRLELTDPRAMRALAHPTRLAVLEHLHEEGSATATQVAEACGESPSACSYHLRARARWGLVEEAPGGRGRERPWRLAARSVTFSSTRGTQEQVAAASLLRRTVLERDDRVLGEFLEREHELAEEWQEAAGFGNGVLHLTLDELNDLQRELAGLLRAYYRPGRAEGTKRVDIIFRALPKPD